MPDYDLSAIQDLLKKMQPAPVSANLPAPQMPQGMDPELVRNTLQRANTLGLVHGMLGTHTPSTYEVMRSGSASPTVPPSPAYDAAKANIMAPLEAEKARVSVLNQQGEVQNKYNLENTKMGLEAGKANNAVPIAELKGMLSAWGALQKGQTARDVAQTGAGARIGAAQIGANAKKDVMGMQIGAANLSPEAQARLADQRNTTGQQVRVPGRGLAATAQSTKIENLAAERAAQNGAAPLASAQADYKANSSSLSNIQKTTDSVNAFEGTARPNIQRMLDAAQKMSDSGSPWLNRPMREWDRKALGSTEMAAFDAARAVAAPEVARVLTTATASGVLSDDARHEAERVFNENATLPQLVAAAHVVMQDFDSRKASYARQIGEIKGRINPAQTNGATVTIRRKRDGTTKTLSSDAAQKYLSSPDFEKVQ